MKFIEEALESLAVFLTALCFLFIIVRFFFDTKCGFKLPGILNKFVAFNQNNLNCYDKEDEKEDKLLLKKLIIAALGSRLVLFVSVVFIKAFITGEINNFSIVNIASWFSQDSPHYVNIAQHGYINYGDDRRLLVFYPLYPLLICIYHFFIPDYYVAGIPVSYYAAGVLVSYTFLVIACYYLYKIMMLETGEKSTSIHTVKYFLIFPFSFFFGLVYPESLFFALSVMVFYYSRKKKWFVAGICGMLAALTKNQGIMLFIPVCIDMFIDCKLGEKVRKADYKGLFKDLKKTLPCAALIPAGFAIYLVINKVISGEWFRFLDYQKEYWSNTAVFFCKNIKMSFGYAKSSQFIFKLGTFVPQTLMFFMVLLLLLFSIKKFRASYTAYTLAVLLLSYSPSWLLSGPRYIASIAPIYIFIAVHTRKNKYVRVVLDAAFVVLLFVFSTTFVMGGTY